MINESIKAYKNENQVDDIKRLKLSYNEKLFKYENNSIYKNHFRIICSILVRDKRL